MGTQVRLEKKEDLERIIKRWKERQSTTRQNAESLQNRTKSYFVQIMTSAIKRDAEKHEEMLQAILDCMDCTVTITPDELGELSSLLSDHLEVEKHSRELAELALKKRRHYITTHLLQYILEDEKKNEVLLDHLNKFKGQIQPYA